MSVTDAPGIYPDIPEGQYHADRSSLSHSWAKLLLPPSCPAKFRWAMDNAPKTKRAFDFGNLAHRQVLGAGADIEVLDPLIHGLKKDGNVADNPRATSAWQNAEQDARLAGKVPVHVDEMLTAQAMAEAVHRHPVAGPLFTEGAPEVSLYANDPDTGVPLRGRVDWLNRPTIVDYKSAATACLGEFARAAAKYLYHMQAAWYLDLAAAQGIDGAQFLLVAQEKTPPYLISVLEFDDEAIGEGRLLKRQAIDTYARCIEADKWPGYPEQIQPISLPLWAISEMEMEL